MVADEKELYESEQKIRDCYEEFLAEVQQAQDLWAITLLDYYRLPIEWWRAEPDEQQDWQQEIPACFAHLYHSGELARLVRRKEEICPDADCCSVPRNLELEYDWLQARGVYDGVPQRTMPQQAFRKLVEYCILVEELGDDPGDCRWRYLFDETSDVEMLVCMARRSFQTPMEQFEAILLLEDYRRQVELKPNHDDWLFDRLWNWMGWVLHEEQGEVSWALYQYLQENDHRFALWDDDMTDAELLQRAADAGIPEAKLELGELYIEDRRADQCRADGSTTPPVVSAEVVIGHLEDVLPYDSVAGLLLAMIYRFGYGVPQNWQRVVHYCRLVAQTEYEGAAAANQSSCIELLAYCCAKGLGMQPDRQQAARQYRRLERSDGFLFDYYSKGEYAPRQARRAVQWWLREQRAPGISCRHPLRQVYAADAPERADEVRWLCGPLQESAGWLERYQLVNARERLYRWLEDGAPKLADEALAPIVLQERVRLLYDAQQNGDARCGAILAGLCAQDEELADRLTELAPDADGIYDWPQQRYEEMLDEIEWEAVRQSRQAQQEAEQRQLWQAELERVGALSAEQLKQELRQNALRQQKQKQQQEAERRSAVDWLLGLSDEQLQRAFDEAASPQPGEWWCSLTEAQQQAVFNAMDIDDAVFDPDEFAPEGFSIDEPGEWGDGFWPEEDL